ncbi:shikimate kinase AroL [Proteus mirabilis]|uniref:shikimate kinase AroL n=1 Tax=Proteus mirabilis TaxID=584 RepID=UPI002DB7A5CD|nr:shikimate kinase AroL [Proteus mirabilis]MEC3988783.1 shikimate kinase AroL [Proteus mirabilis]MEC4037444.1 shikimate kinase AroL [Proteus mirabilis]MEC4065585.1 shikimate kinase AroL [Proteus mirabilis]MEC4098164.1 shikimate kinase AroL [Proteus mirabilis]
MESTIYLIGPRGAGKTTVGKALSLSLDYQFIDTDNWITDKYQQTISSMVEAEGWDVFRQLESDALIQVSQPNQVISTGGGIVLAEKNRVYMKNSGVIVYLQASLETLVERLSQDPNEAQRPSLTGKTLVSEIHDVLIKREPLYMQCADIIVDAGLSINDIIEVIFAKLAK